MLYERLITRNEEDDSILIDGVSLDTMGGNQLLVALGKVVNRLADLEDKIEKGELIECPGGVNYEML
jgi:hypothetical protein